MKLPKNALDVKYTISHLNGHPREHMVTIDIDGDVVPVSDCQPVFISGNGYRLALDPSAGANPNAVLLVGGGKGLTNADLVARLKAFPAKQPVVIVSPEGDNHAAPITCSEPGNIEIMPDGSCIHDFRGPYNAVLFRSSDDDD